MYIFIWILPHILSYIHSCRRVQKKNQENHVHERNVGRKNTNWWCSHFVNSVCVCLCGVLLGHVITPPHLSRTDVCLTDGGSTISIRSSSIVVVGIVVSHGGDGGGKRRHVWGVQMQNLWTHIYLCVNRRASERKAPLAPAFVLHAKPYRQMRMRWRQVERRQQLHGISAFPTHTSPAAYSLPLPSHVGSIFFLRWIPRFVLFYTLMLCRWCAHCSPRGNVRGERMMMCSFLMVVGCKAEDWVRVWWKWLVRICVLCICACQEGNPVKDLRKPANTTRKRPNSLNQCAWNRWCYAGVTKRSSLSDKMLHSARSLLWISRSIPECSVDDRGDPTIPICTHMICLTCCMQVFLFLAVQFTMKLLLCVLRMAYENGYVDIYFYETYYHCVLWWKSSFCLNSNYNCW